MRIKPKRKASVLLIWVKQPSVGVAQTLVAATVAKTENASLKGKGFFEVFKCRKALCLWWSKQRNSDNFLFSHERDKKKPRGTEQPPPIFHQTVHFLATNGEHVEVGDFPLNDVKTLKSLSWGFCSNPVSGTQLVDTQSKIEPVRCQSTQGLEQHRSALCVTTPVVQ